MNRMEESVSDNLSPEGSRAGGSDAAPSNPPERRLRKIATLIGTAISVAAVYYFLDRFRSQAGFLVLSGEIRSLLLALGIGVITYLIAYIPTVAAWHRYVFASQPTLRLRTSAHIYLISQFAKYIPGNVGHYLGRFALSRRAGYPLAAVVAATLLETVSVIWVALAIGFLAGPGSTRSILNLAGLDRFGMIGMISALAGATLALPLVLVGLERLKFRLKPLRDLSVPTWRAVTICAGFYSSTFALMALVVMGLAFFGYQARGYSPVSVLGVVAWSWLAGFLVPGAPAGLGVREVVLSAGLTEIYGEPTALGVVLLFRVVTTLGDGLALLVGLWLRRMTPGASSARDK